MLLFQNLKKKFGTTIGKSCVQMSLRFPGACLTKQLNVSNFDHVVKVCMTLWLKFALEKPQSPSSKYSQMNICRDVRITVWVMSHLEQALHFIVVFAMSSVPERSSWIKRKLLIASGLWDCYWTEKSIYHPDAQHIAYICSGINTTYGSSSEQKPRQTPKW